MQFINIFIFLYFLINFYYSGNKMTDKVVVKIAESITKMTQMEELVINLM